MEKNLNLSRFKKRVELTEKYKEVYDMYYVQNLSQSDISEKTGYSRSHVYHIIHTFAGDYPLKAEEMKNQSKTFTQEEYLRLKDELAKTKEQLKRQSMETAIYKELVAIGKEVYGIDLKKAGTKL